MVYKYHPSTSRWPAKKAVKKITALLPEDFEQFANVSSDPKYYKQNLVKLQVYMKSLDYKLLKEYPKYPVS